LGGGAGESVKAFGHAQKGGPRRKSEMKEGNQVLGEPKEGSVVEFQPPKNRSTYELVGTRETACVLKPPPRENYSGIQTAQGQKGILTT